MIFCEECFQHEEIKNIIQSIEKKGHCELNKTHKNTYICDSMIDCQSTEDVKNVLRQIIEIYTVEEELPEDFPSNKKDLLRHSLEKKWSLFTIDDQQIQSLIMHLFEEDAEFDQRLLTTQVGVLEEVDMKNKSLIIQNNEWEEFVNAIKFRNRFHTNTLNLDNLAYFLQFTSKIIKTGDSLFYRCRISNDNELTELELGAPPKEKASAGRLNPEWITALYLSNDEDICIKEVRAGFKDRVYIGKFQLKENLRVVDLRNFEDITLNGKVDNLKYYLNRSTLSKIAKEFARPTNNDSKKIDYLPLQYISEYVKSLGEYEGILYKSVMDKAAYNLVLFHQNLVECVSMNIKEIDGINYEYKR